MIESTSNESIYQADLKDLPVIDTPLSTKFNIPQTRPALVARPRLRQKMNAGLDGRLILVSAPAGFGKTTLVADWLAGLPAPPHPWRRTHCAWLSLDDQDDSPVRFIGILIAALQSVYPDLGSAQLATLEGAPHPNLQAITRDLVNEIDRHNQPLLVVLDDYHEIQHAEIHRIIHTLVDYSPSNLCLVINTRQDPPLALPRWRARGWSSQITAADLRFDRDETAAFLKDTMHLDVNIEAAALLEERTEGWAAGLQLAALSLGEGAFTPELIADFSGRDRYVADYLLSEVLERLPAQIQDFLLPTAILERFNADLCRAILPESVQTSGSAPPAAEYQVLIEELERANLFIIPLDRQRTWYRFHHLFAQLLRQRLERAMAASEIEALYRRASGWFEGQDLLDEAIHYALKGKDYAFAASKITAFQTDSVWNQSQFQQLRSWAAAIPLETFKDYPQAGLQIALAHMTRNDIQAAVPYIELARGNPHALAEMTLIDSIIIRNQGDVLKALDLADDAARLLESQNQTLYIAARTQSVVCLMTLGHMTEAEERAVSLQREILSQSGQYLNVYIQLIQILGFILERRGRLTEAKRVYLEGIDLVENSGKTLPLVGLLLVRLGAIYYLWNETERATEFCERGLVWGERTGIGDILTHGRFIQVNLAIQCRDEAAAKETLKQLSETLSWPEFSDIDLRIHALQAAYDLRLGNLNAAVRWANSSGLRLDDPPAVMRLDEFQSLAWVRFEEIRHLGLPDQAAKVIVLVDRAIELATAHELVDVMIFFWSLKALLLDLAGDTKQAAAALHQALDLALPGGYIRIFLDFGVPLRDLLQKSLAYEPHMTYKRRLLMAFADEAVPTSTPVSAVSASMDVPIALTPREFEILQLIAAGLSNKAIQEHLTLSKNTVRTHIKNLYAKLAVSSRTQAVRQARESGLL